MNLPKFEYYAPQNLQDACKFLAKHKGDAIITAGGTDILVYLKGREIPSPRVLVGLRNVSKMDYIKYSQSEGLKIGALCTHSLLADSPIVQEKYGVLYQAVSQLGTVEVRNMGTIGGNICNASPSADTPPALLALDAKLRLMRNSGERVVPIDEFFCGPFETALSVDEVLVEIQIPPPPPRSGGSYHHLNKVTAIGETLVGAAVHLTLNLADDVCRDVRIGLCSVAPTPVRARKAEEMLKGKKLDTKLIENASQVAAGETKPRSRADYRREMTAVMVKRALNESLSRIAGC